MGKLLGQELRRLREGRRLSIRETADKVGIAHMTYVNYERGLATPPANRRESLGKALGIARQAIDNLIEDDQTEAFLKGRKLSPAGKQAVRDVLKRLRDRERQQRGRIASSPKATRIKRR